MLRVKHIMQISNKNKISTFLDWLTFKKSVDSASSLFSCFFTRVYLFRRKLLVLFEEFKNPISKILYSIKLINNNSAINPLSTNTKKSSNTYKQLVGCC